MGTLNLKKGMKANTKAICMGMGIKAIKAPKKTALETILLFVERYSLGILYFSIKAFSFSLLLVFLRVFLIMFFLAFVDVALLYQGQAYFFNNVLKLRNYYKRVFIYVI